MRGKEAAGGGGPWIRVHKMRPKTKEMLVKGKGWFVPGLHEKYIKG